MPRKKPRQFTEEEKSVIKQAAAVRLPMEDLAHLLRLDRADLTRMIKKDAALHATMMAGRAQANIGMRQRLYQKGYKEGDMRAIEFWCRTQMGFRTTERVEHTGADGKPIRTHVTGETTTVVQDPTREEILAELKDLNDRMAAQLKPE